MPFSFIKRSQTTFQISRHLIPLTLVAGLSCLVALGMYVFVFLPAKNTLRESSNTYSTVLQVQHQKEAAKKTQEALAEIWKELPEQKDFTRLSVSIASLAKTHHVRIPGMGYDLQTPRHHLATKGILSFEASGKYKAIRAFIFELESQWPNVFIEKLSVERSKRSNEVGFKIKVATFLRQSKNTISTSLQPL
ncbi:MAG: type 4a pilus biogenesis protein PilO [Nitrospirales bacterium]